MHFVVDGVNNHGDGIVTGHVGCGAKAVLGQVEGDHQRGQRTVNGNANTLASFVKEQMAENGDEIPDWLSEVVSTYEKVSVGVRKG